MNSGRKMKTAFTPIGEVIETLLQHHRPSLAGAMTAIWEVWASAVGPEIAANARPAAVKGGILLVNVSNSTWRHHLRFLEDEIINKLNAAVGEQRVQRLQFKIGPI